MNSNSNGIDCSARNDIKVETSLSDEMKTVKEVCEITGVTRKTLFYYDKIGLLKPSYRKGSQRQKLYSEKAIKKLCGIRILKEAGFNINQIRLYLEKPSNHKSLFEEVKENNKNKLRKIEVVNIFTCVLPEDDWPVISVS